MILHDDDRRALAAAVAVLPRADGYRVLLRLEPGAEETIGASLALEVLLRRLAALDATLDGAVLSDGEAAEPAAVEPLLDPGRGLDYPLLLATLADVAPLRTALTAARSAFARHPGAEGGRLGRTPIALDVRVADPGVLDEQDLAQRLAGHEAP